MTVAQRVLRAAAVAALWAGFSACAAPSVTEVHTLANGMKFIVLERHDAPVVSFVIVVVRMNFLAMRASSFSSELTTATSARRLAR